MIQIPQGNIYQPWNKRADKTFLRCQRYRYHKAISTNLGTRERTRRFSDVNDTDTTRQYLSTLEQERRQDVSQMSMMPIPQGNIYQPWNKREDKTFLRCQRYRYHKAISTNLGTRERTRRFSDVNDTDTTRQYLSTLEQERRQDVSQMSMMPIPQGNIYQPWNKRENKTFLRCQ